jgi:hypothetical protein
MHIRYWWVRQNFSLKLNFILASLDNISKEYSSLDFNHVKFDKSLTFRNTLVSVEFIRCHANDSSLMRQQKFPSRSVATTVSLFVS